MKRGILWLLLAVILLINAGCADDLLGGPSIDSMTITPATLSVNDTGMTDEFFTVTLEVSGFEQEIDLDETRIFFMAGPEEVEAVFGNSSQTGNQLTFGQIATGWFQDQPLGTYDINAEVNSVADDSGRAAESVRQINLATVTITP